MKIMNKTLHILLDYLRLKIYRRIIRDKYLGYGIIEALLFPVTIDAFLRYANVINEIKSQKNYPIRTILEVGSGGRGISTFLNPIGYEIILLDISRMHLYEAKGENLHVICADGCHLPFRSSVFDLVTSIATFEHIPKDSRDLFAKEAERVARRKLILHFPAQSDNGMFLGEPMTKSSKSCIKLFTDMKNQQLLNTCAHYTQQ
jgi:ubiquinone/menaquinone biosynthesis C-methylase UbiE